MLKKILFMVLFLAFAGIVLAEDVLVEAVVSPDKISIKESAQLTVTVHGGGKGENAPQLPHIDGLDARYLGPSTSISIINGQYSSERSFIYNLFPVKTGRFQVPPLTVTVEGKDYTTKPADLEVVAGNIDRNDTSSSAPSENLKDRLFMVLAIPKTKVYVGEKVPVSVKLMVAQVPLHNIQFPKIDKNGFVMDDFSQPRQYTQAVNGTKYNVIDFSTYLYPVAAGALTVGPVQIEGSLLYRNPQQQRRNPSGGSFFNDDFFNGFFDSYQEKPITASSETLKLEVMPLPEEGRPTGFSGAVGQLDFDASISPAEVRVGDPVTLRMKVSGSANFRSIQVPVFSDSHFKTYDPQVKNEGNALTLEQVIIPTDVNIVAVPALYFNYFDPISGEYKTLTQGPFNLKVTAPQPGQEFKVVGFSELQAPAAPVDYVQKYIKQPFDRSVAVLKTPRFWMKVGIFIVIWGLWMAWRRFRARLASDKSFARRVNALKHAKRGLAQAERALNSSDAKDFYGILYKTLNSYVRDKGLKEESIPGLKAIYEAGEFVRFAGARPDPSQMRSHLEQARQIVK